MYRFQKTIYLVLAIIVMTSLVLSGCGQAPSTDKTGTAAASTPASTAAASSAAPAAASLPEVNLSWYNVGGTPADLQMVNDELNKYLKDKINASVTMKFLDWGVYDKQLATMMAAGDQYDIAFWPSWMGAGYRNMVAKGYFKDITELWDKYAPKTKSQLNPAFVEGSKVDGKNYGIPANKELAHSFGIVWVKELADKYNLDMKSVKKLEDLEPMLKVIKEKEPGIIPFNCSSNDNFSFLPDWNKIGGDAQGVVRYGDTKVINELEQPETVAILKLARDWYLKGYVNKDAATLEDRKPNMKAKKMFCQLSPMKPTTASEETANYGYEFDQVEISPRYIQGNDTTGSLQCISATSPNPERALMFLELVNTDKYVNNLINFGIEGKHYVKVSDNIIDLPAGLTADKSGYHPNSQWIFGNNYINYLWKTDDPDKWNKFAEFNDSATASKILSFSYDSTPVKNEESAIHNINQQYGKALNVGAVDPDKVLPEYLAKLKEAGVDKVIAEKQKQIDAWLAAQK